MTGKSVWAIVAIAAVAILAYVIFGQTSTDQAVPANEPSGGSAIVSVKIPETLSERAQIGELAFNAKCAVCHGPSAEGQNGVAPPLVHRIYEPNHHADIAFVLAAQNGVRSHHWTFGNMPPIEGLTKADVLNIATYIRELQRENGIN